MTDLAVATRPITTAWLTIAYGRAKTFVLPLLGIGALLFIWWLGGRVIESDPELMAFATFAPAPTFAALWELIHSGDLWPTVSSSLYRILVGLAIAIVIGVPTGILIGYVKTFMDIVNVPFQLVRMISPLAWMPIAVLAYESWDGAIIFLIVMAAIWPIIFSTAHGVSRIDPSWFKVAKNLGASAPQMLLNVVMPAVAGDILAGIRLAVGVAWVVLVPAEYLGVTSGLGYAINDARDTLSYDLLAAIVLVIGLIGYLLDGACALLVRKANWHHE